MTFLVPGRDRSVFYAPTVTAAWAAIRCSWEPATCAGTRSVSGRCRMTAEEAPREHVGRKWSLQPMGRGEGLTFSEARTVGYDVTLEAGTERVHFNVSSDDTPEVLERKAREAVEKWKASE